LRRERGVQEMGRDRERVGLRREKGGIEERGRERQTDREKEREGEREEK